MERACLERISNKDLSTLAVRQNCLLLPCGSPITLLLRVKVFKKIKILTGSSQNMSLKYIHKIWYSIY